MRKIITYSNTGGLMAYWYSTTFILHDKTVKGLLYFFICLFSIGLWFVRMTKNGIGEQTDIERDFFFVKQFYYYNN